MTIVVERVRSNGFGARDLDVELTWPMTVVVGPNESGKSQVIATLQLAILGRLVPPPGVKIEKTEDGVFGFVRSPLTKAWVRIDGTITEDENSEPRAWFVERGWKRDGDGKIKQSLTQSINPIDAKGLRANQEAVAATLIVADELWNPLSLFDLSDAERRTKLLMRLLPSRVLEDYVPEDCPTWAAPEPDDTPDKWVNRAIDRAKERKKSDDEDLTKCVARIESSEAYWREPEAYDGVKLVQEIERRRELKNEGKRLKAELAVTTKALEMLGPKPPHPDPDALEISLDKPREALAQARARGKIETEIAAKKARTLVLKNSLERAQSAKLSATNAKTKVVELESKGDRIADLERQIQELKLPEPKAPREPKGCTKCGHIEGGTHAAYLGEREAHAKAKDAFEAQEKKRKQLSAEIGQLVVEVGNAVTRRQDLDLAREVLAKAERDAERAKAEEEESRTIGHDLAELEKKLETLPAMDERKAEEAFEKLSERHGLAVKLKAALDRWHEENQKFTARSRRLTAELAGAKSDMRELLGLTEDQEIPLEAFDEKKMDDEIEEIRVLTNEYADRRAKHEAYLDDMSTKGILEQRVASAQTWIKTFQTVQADMLGHVIEQLTGPVCKLTGQKVELRLINARGNPDCEFVANGVPVVYMSDGQRLRFLAGLIGGMLTVDPDMCTWAPLFVDRIEAINPPERRLEFLSAAFGFVAKGVFDQAVCCGCPDTKIESVRGKYKVVHFSG